MASELHTGDRIPYPIPGRDFFIDRIDKVQYNDVKRVLEGIP